VLAKEPTHTSKGEITSCHGNGYHTSFLVTESPWQPATQPRNLGVHSKVSANRIPHHYRHRKAEKGKEGVYFTFQLQELVSPGAKKLRKTSLVKRSAAQIEFFNYFAMSQPDCNMLNEWMVDLQ